MTIDTPRLRLVPFSAEDLLALIDGSPHFGERFGTTAMDELRNMYSSYADQISPVWLAALRSSSGVDPWLHGFAVVHREENRAIGTVGFKGPPDETGMVEIAYGIVPRCQGRGYATEAAAAFVDFASRDARVRLVRAHTMPTQNASTRVLDKCGFANVGDVVDPDDGTVWRWERRPIDFTDSTR